MNSTARVVFDDILSRVVDTYDLTEAAGPDGAPYRTLSGAMGEQTFEVGNARIFQGGPVHKLVTISMTVEQIGMDSHMLFAFTAPDSLVPHFTLDSVLAGGYLAFHCDLIPRVDPGANLGYLDEVFEPLTATYESLQDLEGLTKAHLSPRQYSIMSAWMLASRATEDAFQKSRAAFDTYLDHWFALNRDGVSVEVSGDPADRDRRNRAAIFNYDVDPVWAQVARLVGDEVSEELRQLLEDQDLPADAVVGGER